MRRGWLLAGALTSLLVAGVATAFLVAPREPPPPRVLQRPPDVVFVVIDTLRSDRTHLCGYEHPNTPVLDGLRDEGWAVSCDARSPATWTLPSHLSLFTGRPYLELHEHPDDAVSTIADGFAARGYQTVGLSANTVLRKDPRFHQGFDSWRAATSMPELKGKRFRRALVQALDEVDPELPLYLFVNLIDAHSPYPAIPDDLGWLPPQPALGTRRFEKDVDSPFARFMEGRMAAEERADFLVQLDHGYVFGVSQADANVGVLLDELRQRGRLDRARVVVTSDHGEMLGEHDAIGHGDTLFEPGMRIPFLYRDSSVDAQPPLPAELDVRAVHDLLLDGTFPTEPSRWATNHVFRFPDAWTGVALWPGDGSKLVYHDGEFARYDLRTDPGEDRPLPLDESPDAEELRALAKRVDALIDPELDDETVELLKAAGYVQ
ncbi:MAG: sulfatase-like hydrolase/transferase [Alphaproteobacteria bacterium]|nr:sulfatase-like hydrolase/transferase [Alphaproteobacteria bacterium]MCB9696242.1 sulfatase-like hydrolase/transferase [Alphaproteobacteria bacterium]